MKTSQRPNQDRQDLDIVLTQIPTSTLPEPADQGRAVVRQENSVQQQEAGDDNVILHRDEHFFVRAVYRPNQRRQPHQKPTGNSSIFSRSMLEQIRWLLAERQRKTEIETRLLPNEEAIDPVQTRAFAVPAWLERLVVCIGLIASLVAHAYNMFNFPGYEQDEGTYMSSAWAILHGMLQAYPYRYDHPPLGWIQIAAWVQLTGGFFTFGNALNSGRVLMLLFALGGSLLVYLITHRLSGSRSAALLAMAIFSLSPLSMTYQRLVLLDNIATFWLLLSLYLLVVGNSRLFCIVSAAVSFGIAILTKEVFLLFLPGMLYAVWLHTTKFQRKFSLVTFIYIIISCGSAFILMAILKGELLPTGVLPWDHHPHLSLFETFVNQLQRSQDQGKLITSWYAWSSIDLLLIVASTVATLINLVGGWWNRRQWLLVILAVSFWLLLLRGGVVFPFYIIPLIPLMALNVALAINSVMRWLSKRKGFNIARAILILGVIGAIVPYNLLNSTPIFMQHPTSAQTDALLWVRNNVPHNAVVIINNYLYTDLHEAGGEGVADGATYPYAHVYLNVAFDPELHDGLLHGDWNHIDYIVADTAMLHDIKTLGGQMLLVDRALHHAILRAEFRADNYNQHIVLQIYQVIHSTG